MLNLLRSVLFFYAVFFVKTSLAAPVVLTPEPLPGPIVFATINGVAGFNSESLVGGNISAAGGGFSQLASFDASGNFQLAVAANSAFVINSTLVFDGLPDVIVSYSGHTALIENEERTVDLMRSSGRLLAKVNVIGGTAQSASISTTATIFVNSVREQYRSQVSPVVQNAQVFEALFTSVSNSQVTVSGSVGIISDNGCLLNESIVGQDVFVNDSVFRGKDNPNIVELTVDVTGKTCNKGSVNGEFLLDGLDTSVELINHQLIFSGEDTVILNLTAPGNYSTGSVLEGAYQIIQSSVFAGPYSNLSFPRSSIDVIGDTVLDVINEVGTSHGSLLFNGDWNYADVSSAKVRASGVEVGDLSASMFADDAIDISTGNFDFVLAAGSWQASQFDLSFNSVINGRSALESLSIKLQSDGFPVKYTIAAGQWLDLSSISLSTAKGLIELSVQQASAEAPVTIDRITISGVSQVVDPITNSAISTSVINVSSTGSAAIDFVETVYGLPGTYSLTARGLGSDGRQYSANFEVTLLDTNPVPVPDPTPEPDPTPVPDPTPEPDPTPVPDPTPEPDPTPVPDPTPEPDPTPVPDPTPEPDPTPVPDPTPEPDPTPDPDNGSGLACFSIDSVKLHRHHKMNKDLLQIKSAGFRMADDAMVDLAQDDVFITLDGIVYEFPAGSFKQKGKKRKFEYKSPSYEMPKIKLSLDFEKSKWSLKVNKADTTYIDNSDGVDITLSIGGFQGSENVLLKSKNKHQNKLVFKRKPKSYCRAVKEDDDDDSNDHDMNDSDHEHNDRCHYKHKSGDDDDDELKHRDRSSKGRHGKYSKWRVKGSDDD